MSESFPYVLGKFYVSKGAKMLDMAAQPQRSSAILGPRLRITRRGFKFDGT